MDKFKGKIVSDMQEASAEEYCGKGEGCDMKNLVRLYTVTNY